MSNLDETWINKLVEKGEIDSSAASKIINKHSESGKNIEDIILEEKVLNEDKLYSLLSEELKTPYINLEDFVIDPDVVGIIPESIAREYNIVPLFKIKDILTIATAKPLDLISFDLISRKTNCFVDYVLSTPTGIKKAIDKCYKGIETTEEGTEGKDSLSELLEVIEFEQESPDDSEEDVQSLAKIADEAPLIRLVNIIIIKAIEDGASDIHIEPEQERVRVRYRLDGTLHEVESLPLKLHLPMISRIKVMAGLDIIEKRKPQDGRVSVRLKDREVDLRISIFPTARGNKAVMRILDKSRGLHTLEEIGFSHDELSSFRELIHRPNGIILITGPTGSGKTSTLYGALVEINSPEINITTLEDPVEYQIDGINQGQISPNFGLTFASGLRSILRQDPNVVLVGEMRDTETAEIAIRASLTGHLVFSTLHTNDAVLAISRLIDMGVEPFLIASSLSGVLAQRLVRKICTECKTSYQPSQESLEFIEKALSAKNIKFFRGKGCANCRNSGYKGRMGVFELFIVNDRIRTMIVERKSVDEIKRVAVEGGMRTLYDSGIEKVCQGTTTIEEVISVTTQ